MAEIHFPDTRRSSYMERQIFMPGKTVVCPVYSLGL